MTATQRPESTAVQMAAPAAVGNLPPEIRQQLELRKLSNQVAGKLAELNWGKSLDHDTRRAVADWGGRFRIDVTTEIHVLGGNVYLNSAYYLRRLSELIEAGLVEYAYADHIEDDPRLAKLGPEGEGEATRRLRMRLMYGIKGEPASCVAFRVKLRSMDREVVGVKSCGGGVRKNDPVGDMFPTETAESRAARRAMRLLVSHVPPAMATELEAIEASAEQVSARVGVARQASKAQNAALEVKSSPMALPAQGDPYGPVTTIETPEPVTAPEPTLSAAYRYKLPFGPMKGTSIGAVPPVDLDAWYGWAKEQPDPDASTRGFIAAYEELQNERDLERGE